MKKTSIIDLKGGLGNQIFILSLAHKLEVLGNKVLIDLSFYDQKHDYPRNIELDLEKFNFKTINLKHNKLFEIFDNCIHEISISDLKNIKNYSRFKGYYQDCLFIDKNYLKNKLELNTNSNSNSLMIHMRKGDYIKLNEDLKNNYFINAISNFSNTIDDLEIDIFSDDDKIDTRFISNRGIKINNIVTQNNKSPLDTLREMVSYENFIISNSTFSFFAAFLGETEKSKITYPKPWFRNSNFEVKRIPENWISVENI